MRFVGVLRKRQLQFFEEVLKLLRKGPVEMQVLVSNRVYELQHRSVKKIPMQEKLLILIEILAPSPLRRRVQPQHSWCPI